MQQMSEKKRKELQQLEKIRRSKEQKIKVNVLKPFPLAISTGITKIVNKDDKVVIEKQFHKGLCDAGFVSEKSEIYVGADEE